VAWGRGGGGRILNGIQSNTGGTWFTPVNLHMQNTLPSRYELCCQSRMYVCKSARVATLFLKKVKKKKREREREKMRTAIMNTEVLSSRNVFILLILIFMAQNPCTNMDTVHVTVTLFQTGACNLLNAKDQSRYCGLVRRQHVEQ